MPGSLSLPTSAVLSWGKRASAGHDRGEDDGTERHGQFTEASRLLLAGEMPARKLMQIFLRFLMTSPKK